MTMGSQVSATLDASCLSRAWRLAFGLVWNRDDAFDVVQAACLVAAAKPGALPTDDVWPWLARVVTLEALKLRSKRAAFERARGEAGLANSGDAMDVDAALLLERKETQQALRAALASLPVEERDALTLTHIAGLSVRDAAENLGVSSSTVDRRVQSGLAGLRRRLGEKQHVTGAALAALCFEDPPQGMDTALKGWLGMVSGQVELAPISGATPMKIALLTGLGFVILLCAAGGCFWHFHHDQASEHLQQMHEFFRALHGK